MPAVAEQHAGVDEDGAGELAGVSGGPPHAPGAAEVVEDEVGSVDAERVQRLADEGRMAVNGVREVAWLAGVPEAGGVPGHGPAHAAPGDALARPRRSAGIEAAG